MRSAIYQHLRDELDSGTCTLPLGDIESLATWAYEHAGLGHTLGGELPHPIDLVTRLGTVVRYGRPPGLSPAVRSHDRIVVRHARDPRDVGLVAGHEGAHVVADEAASGHTHADVVTLTFCLLVPRQTILAARAAGDLSTTGLALYQPHAPAWALTLRIEMALVWLRSGEAA